MKKTLVGLLTFAVVFVSFSCRNASDGEQPNLQEQLKDLDAESYIFLRHRFVAENDKISAADSESTRLAWSNQHFEATKDYMIQKVADFKHKVRDLEPAGNFLQPICDEVWTDRLGNDFNGYENGGSGLDPIIGNNNGNYTKFLGAIGAKLVVRDQTYIPGVKLEAHYAALASRAYNDSLGYLHDSDQLKFNQERNDLTTTLQSEPVNATYTANDYELIERNLHGMLQQVSRETGVSVDTLVDAVNLNLLNVGMWGTSNLSKRAGFQISGNNGKLQSSQLSDLDRRDLLHNLGGWREKYTVQYDKEQQNSQEQGKGL